MGPSFSSKNGVRYHFYVSTALRGRKHQAGSVTRISAPEVESLVEAAVRNDLKLIDAPREEVLEHAEGVTVSGDRIRIALRKGQSKRSTIQIPWSPKAKGQTETRPGPSERTDQKFLKSIVRAHAWLNDLSTGHHDSIEDLAAAADLHPKVIRQGLRMAFLAPQLTMTALGGEPVVALKLIPKLLPLSWREQRRISGSIQRRAAMAAACFKYRASR